MALVGDAAILGDAVAVVCVVACCAACAVADIGCGDGCGGGGSGVVTSSSRRCRLLILTRACLLGKCYKNLHNPTQF